MILEKELKEEKGDMLIRTNLGQNARIKSTHSNSIQTFNENWDKKAKYCGILFYFLIFEPHDLTNVFRYTSTL